MARKDKVHDVVRTALENDGWTITDDPYYIKSFDADYEVDLGAEKLFASTAIFSRPFVAPNNFSAPKSTS